MTVTQVSYPVAPTVDRLDGTLLDAAEVSDGINWHDGNDLFESYNCMKFDSDAFFCAPNSKTFTQTAGWTDGIRFAAYGGVTCKAIGLDQETMLREVGKVFEMGESTAVERGLMEQRFRADTANPVRWSAPVDITPAAGAVKPAVGVSLLEGYAGSVYVGAPTLHMPRVIASLLLGTEGVVLDGRTLRTKLGSKIAAGAGYDYPNFGPTGVEAAVGEKWLYATGSVVVMRGESIIRQSMNTTNNDVVVLAERGYVAAVDCFTAAVRVQVTA